VALGSSRGVSIDGVVNPGFEKCSCEKALAFRGRLHAASIHAARRCVWARAERRSGWRGRGSPFPSETAKIRTAMDRGAVAPGHLDRRVEITGRSTARNVNA